ncbi:MAG: hypothetical protein KDI09_15020, partial [Halioglobus sp.]|nr:hypothetical protein [Halioglobus sp.]
AFDLDACRFTWGFHLQRKHDKWTGYVFNPDSDAGPAAVNDFHINMVHVENSGIYLSGLRTGAMLHLNDQWQVREVCSLARGAHNAQPWNDGIIFNDTGSDCVRYVKRDGIEQAYAARVYPDSDISFSGVDDTRVARQGFCRGLTTYAGRFIVAGSSPSTITLLDTQSRQWVSSVNLSMDIRNAIHGLEVWPYDTV